MAISVNDKCPCGSQIKYKKCCQVLHKGKIAVNALELMKSRYSAYVVKNVKYIMKTTHINNVDYTSDTKSWSWDLLEFCNHSEFKNLRILNFEESKDISYVQFHASIFINSKDCSFTENSKFIKINDIWYYHSAQIQEGK